MTTLKTPPLSRWLAPIALMTMCGCSSDDAPTSDSEPAATEDAGGTPPPSTEPDSGTSAPSIDVTGPVTGGLGTPFTASLLDLDAEGYSETEFFYEGDATAYTLEGEMTEDGVWSLSESTEAPFKSRLLVRRPIDDADFNGTVILEWLNVSGGADGDPGFMYTAEEVLREGYAWVGVSAQMQGVEGGGFALVAEATPLKVADPERYGSLVHPGDAYSFDIYTQAARVVRGEGSIDVLDGLVPERLIAYGESQSAMRLVSYVNGVHPLTGVYDGFFIHSRGVSGIPFDNEAMLGIGGTPASIRADLDEPVFQFQTETDVFGIIGYLPARQPDTDTLRSWEVAGTAHADKHILDFNAGVDSASILGCEGVNDGPQHFVIKAALHSLNVWMTDGTPPPTGDLLEVDATGVPMVDEHGNTLGGVRTPAVDVPIATLSGLPPDGQTDILCSLFGSTVPFDQDKLLSLYPTHEEYVTLVTEAAQAAAEAGFLLGPEEAAMIAEAEAAPIPN